MFKKKLLTLACAAGILACGACFMPPLPHRAPVPPPLRAEMQGIETIRVEGTNVSAQRNIDPSELTNAVANSINWRSGQTGIRASVQNGAVEENAVLKIVILSERATPGMLLEKGRQLWSFQLKTSSTLTGKDGHVIWADTDGGLELTRHCPRTEAADLWKDPMIHGWLSRAVSNRLVYRMFSGFSSRE